MPDSSNNPLTGMGWGSPAGQNPLYGGSPVQAPPGVGSMGDAPGRYGGQWGNPGGYSNPGGANEINRNIGLENIITGQLKNQYAPQWEQLMMKLGGGAGNFFSQLMNLGSPYYQQKQAEALTQGVGQNQQAMAQAQQQLRAQGFGSTPSGANAAMIGGMNMQGGQNLAEQYLQNLFQNEQLQLQGAQGAAGVAGMFNPAQLLGGTSVGAGIYPGSSFFQNFATMAGAAKDLSQTGQNIMGSVAMCPAAGSLILMADGTQQRVEALSSGDRIAAIGGETCTVDAVPCRREDIIEVELENGLTCRNSVTHTFLLPKGGFVVACHSLGREVVTSRGPSRITRIKLAGKDYVFDILTDGSHTYCADGVWAQGGEVMHGMVMSEEDLERLLNG